MIVSFVMTLLTFGELPYLWYFYKSLDMAKKHSWAVIAQEEYFVDPALLKRKGRVEAYDKEWNIRNELNYDLPSKEDFEKIKCYKIPSEIDKKIIKEAGSICDAQMMLIDKEMPLLEQNIEEGIKCIGGYDKIDAFITLCHIPSLSAVAKKYDIPVIHFELGALREPTYLKTGYFDKNCLYGDASVDKRFEIFCTQIRQDDRLLLTNKELLSIFLKKDYLYYLNHYDDVPKYELGIALGYAKWALYLRNTFFDDSELLYRAKKMYRLEDITVRKHPGDPYGASYPKYDYCRDNSFSTIDFILKCKRIASLGSNVSIEAKLYGKEGYTVTKCPAYFSTKHEIEDVEIQGIDKMKNSFFFIGYLVPFELIWDDKYIKWRLNNASEVDIYKKHLEYYLRKKNIPTRLLLDDYEDEEGRFDAFLKCQEYSLDEQYAHVPLKEKRVFTAPEYKKEINRLKDVIRNMEDKNE